MKASKTKFPTDTEILEGLLKVDLILQKVSSIRETTNESNELGDFIPEPRAQELLGKKTTWFYYQRKSGKLTGYRVGKRIFYKKSEIEKMIEDGKE